MRDFDLIVIGSGSGLDVAVAAANRGLRVAIVEKGPLGGTCLNRGCIPSKMLIHSADLVEEIRGAGRFGIKVKGYEVDYTAIVDRVTSDVDSESKSIENALMSSENPVLFKGLGKFTGRKIIEVNGEEITAEKILIAAGARPKIPEIEGLRESGFITSDDALRLREQPKTLAIIGGGYIAAELAHFFGSLGTEVYIIHRKELLINSEDEEVARAFTGIASKKFRVFTSSEPVSVRREGGTYEIAVKDLKTSSIVTVSSDQLLVAAGRVPNSDLLDLEKTGVLVDPRGYIKVNEYLETNVPGIYALGDIIGKYQFKHAANLEAEYALQNMLFPEEKLPVDYTAMPHAIFTSPQIASVGSTEQELRSKGVEYIAAKWRYIDSGMGKAIEDHDGFVKFLYDKKTLKILGCHIIGTDAATMIHEVIVAMKSGKGDAFSILDAVHIHPALSEVVQRAASNIHIHDHDH
ncbi:MAG: dihydrolipoyl dehydrogenase [Candidatus Methanosuratincola sp.]|uniref:NADPH-dependent mycothiol reductase Mtr n=1 Tax=Methanosuratincola subterraneus TaxID=2593994 RepID=A0A444L910_METS7|nr:dihydrolipoyl dehydrogenase [Candidatus Methanosuratincola sp.]RWX74077.1 MAG: NADPH-dependent mycothiol reductase Mtr [Candidatus Methanosuratincola subterraneus]